VASLRYMTAMPGRSYDGALPPLSPEETMTRQELRRHVEKLAGEIGARTLYRASGLEAAAAHIERTLASFGYAVSVQSYTAGGLAARNVEAQRAGGAAEIVVIGAHYDTAGPHPGANDNASGVAAGLDLARIFKDATLPRTLRFVFFPNEEPPFFQSPDMGSFVYARRCRERGDNVVAMLALETIAYYSEKPGSQSYPFPDGGRYPGTANFIGFVGNLTSRALVRRCIQVFRETTPFPSEGIAAPAGIPGIGWSDHWSFWQHGYPAVMVTDTALFRYPHYHTAEDTPDKLDYDRTARVVRGLERVVRELASG